MTTGIVMIPFLGCQAPDSWIGWILLLSLSILGTLIPILSMNIGLQFVGAARGSVIITLQPVLTIVLSTLFLHDTLTLQQWVGGAMVIAAVILLQRSPDREGKSGKSA
jgi:drug/metabolite transporter (DMT)-like permease